MQQDLQLSPHFWLSEFTTSQEAVRHGWRNDPTEPDIANLRRLAVLLEAARVLLGGKPILVSSGYRSEVVNAAVGGSLVSAHMTGRAVDFTCPGYGSPLEVCRRLSDAGLPFDKLIQEGGAWVHIQVPLPDRLPRKRVFTAHFSNRGTSYTEGL